MTLGSKIKKLRSEQGLTQKDVADLANVTFQTVSKWENDENEPDVATLRKLASLFGCSLDYLLSEEEPVERVTEEKKENDEPTISATLICEHCHEKINKDDLEIVPITRRVRHGRTHHTEEIGQRYYHKDCIAKIREEEAKERHAAHVKAVSSAAKKCWVWSIAAAVLTLVISLIIFLSGKYVHPVASVFISLGITYAIFAAVYCILSGSYLGDVFLWCASRSIRFPGLIFTLDFGGIVWLIWMKVLFAVIGFLFGVLMLMFGVALTGSLAAISFPFVLMHNIHNDYEDSLFL